MFVWLVGFSKKMHRGRTEIESSRLEDFNLIQNYKFKLSNRVKSEQTDKLGHLRKNNQSFVCYD